MRAVLLGAAFGNVLLIMFNIVMSAGWEYIALNVMCSVLCYIGYVSTFSKD